MSTSGVTTVPLETALEKIVSSDDLTADQKIRAIQAATRECNEKAIIEELQKINTYLAIITDHKI